MTHGDKAKAKKTASKASGNQKSTASKAVKSGKSSQAVKTAGKEGVGGKKAPVKAAAKAKGSEAAPQKQQAVAKAAAPKAAAPKAVPAKGGSNGKPAVRGSAPEAGGFSNAVIGNAFKRAVKKFPNAFRRLTD
jgi:hypothetical protein